MQSILICGGGTMQLPAIRIARREGIRCVVADGNPSCPGRSEADAFENIDLYDVEGMTEAARRHSVDGVFTAGTDFSTTVAWVADALGLPGIPYDVALRAKDKGLMRETLRAAGVNVPPFVVYGQGEVGADRVPFPAVVKPVDNMGSRGVKTVYSPDERERAVAEAMRSSRSGRVICEAFIPGSEYSIDAISYRGSVSICGIGDRHIAFSPYFVETGHTIPTRAGAEQKRVLSHAFSAAVRAIGIDPGAAKGDVFLVERASAPEWLADRVPHGDWIPVVGEIAARLSGGYMSGWTYPLARGAEPTLAALRIALGQSPEGLAETRRNFSAERAIMSIPGIVRRFDSVPEHETVFLTRKPGDRVALPTSNVEKCGNLIATATSYEAACTRCDGYIRSLSVRLEPEDPGTEAFLFGGVLETGDPAAPLTVWDADLRNAKRRNLELEQEVCTRLRSLIEAQLQQETFGFSEANESEEGTLSGTGNRDEGAGASSRTECPWTECLWQRLDSLDASLRDSVSDTRKASRADCVRFLTDNLRIEIPPRFRDILCCFALLAIERGGLQGCEYLIDTVTRPEDVAALCQRLVIRSRDG